MTDCLGILSWEKIFFILFDGKPDIDVSFETEKVDFIENRMIVLETEASDDIITEFSH